MTDRSLLSRLDKAAPNTDDIRRVASAGAIERSIVENLRRLFSTRQGEAPSAPRCGIPDFVDLFSTHSDPTRRLCSSIKDMIEEFEPRLKDVAVRRLPEVNAGSLRFSIVARMKVGEESNAPFQAETIMKRLDHFSVERS